MRITKLFLKYVVPYIVGTMGACITIKSISLIPDGYTAVVFLDLTRFLVGSLLWMIGIYVILKEVKNGSGSSKSSKS